MRILETLMLTSFIGLVFILVTQRDRWLGEQLITSTTGVALPIHDATLKDLKGAAPTHKTTQSPAEMKISKKSGQNARIRGNRSEKSAFAAAGSTVKDEPLAPSLPLALNVPPAALAAIPRLVPDSDSLPVGTPRAELRSRYGTPAFQAAASYGGGLIERYYYVASDHSNVVIATLRNGKLVSTQTEQH